MDAILLTHDIQLGLAQLVHKTYAWLWPGHGFTFRIPFAASTRGGAFAYLSAQQNCMMVKAPSAIRPSMAALLDGIDGSEWVFWCIDDRFPIAVDGARATDVVDGLSTISEQVEEVKLLHWREPLLRQRMTIGGTSFRRQAAGSRARGFWHHHFVRADVLRAVFLRNDVGDDRRISSFGELIRAREDLLFRGTAQVPRPALLTLGEPLVEGQLTRNGRRWLELMRCDVPPYGCVDRDVEFG